MKKLFTLLTLCGLTSLASSQVVFSSRFDNWAVGDPTDWMGNTSNISSDSVVQVTTGTVYGANAVRLRNASTTHKRFTTQPLQVYNGLAYDITFWVKGQGDIRTGLFDGRSTGFGYAPYNSYISVNSSSWASYTQTIVCANDTVAGEFILSVRNTVPAGSHLEVDSVVIALATPSTVSIYDIQYTTGSPANSPYMNQVVTTRGVVTGKHTSGYFIQDGSGPYRGVYVFDATNAATVNRGDSIEITGSVTENFNQTEIETVTAFSVISTGNPEPAALTTTTAGVNAEQYEGVIVQVVNAICVDDNSGFGMWKINNGATADTCKVHDLLYHYNTPVIGTYYNVRGPVYYAYSEFRIEPRDISDVTVTTSVAELEEEQALKAFPNPGTDIQLMVGSAYSTVRVFNLQGELVQSISLNGRTQIGLELPVSGMYLVQAGNELGLSRTLHVIRF